MGSSGDSGVDEESGTGLEASFAQQSHCLFGDPSSCRGRAGTDGCPLYHSPSGLSRTATCPSKSEFRLESETAQAHLSFCLPHREGSARRIT